jgi:succinyl-CoA synthetase beta subunit
VVSTEGGMNIEEVAAKTPEKIVTFSIDPVANICPYHVRKVSKALGLSEIQPKQLSALLTNLYRAFVEKDMSLLEINPLILTKSGDLVCLDAKVGFDGNALFRHPDVLALRDETEEDAKEVEASKSDLNYIALDGTIGCMVNGAGLAMATMDIIKLYGEAPANFLDVGGGATKEKVAAAFKIITSDPKVKGILVNIFGGIMRCDVIAEGVIAAVKEGRVARCRWWCGSRAPTRMWERRCWSIPGATSCRPTISTTRRDARQRTRRRVDVGPR